MVCTGKSLSEALIFASTNPQYDNRLFIVNENCKLRIPGEHVVYTNCCFCFVLTFRKFWCTPCSADVVSFWKRFTCNSKAEKRKRRRRRKVYILSSALLDDCRFLQSSAIRETWWHLICITMVKGRNFCPTKSGTRSWLDHFDFQYVVHLFSC